MFTLQQQIYSIVCFNRFRPFFRLKSPSDWWRDNSPFAFAVFCLSIPPPNFSELIKSWDLRLLECNSVTACEKAAAVSKSPPAPYRRALTVFTGLFSWTSSLAKFLSRIKCSRRPSWVLHMPCSFSCELFLWVTLTSISPTILHVTPFRWAIKSDILPTDMLGSVVLPYISKLNLTGVEVKGTAAALISMLQLNRGNSGWKNSRK